MAQRKSWKRRADLEENPEHPENVMIKGVLIPFIVLLLIWVVLIAALGWLGLGIAVVITIGLVIYIAFKVRQLLRNLPIAPDEDEQPVDSLVLLKKFYSEPTLEDVEAAAFRVFGAQEGPTLGPHPLPEELGGGAGFTLARGDIRLSLIAARARYCPPTEALLESLPEELGEALASHSCWLAVDSNIPSGTIKDEEIFSALGRFLAEFVDDQIVMIYTPTFNKGALWKDEMRETLVSDPLSVFGPGPHARVEMNNVRQVPADDAEMIAAIEEARTRFPEFCTAFANAPTKAGFLVKARFEEEEEVEHMWISVTELTDTLIYGKLINSPNAISNVREGQFVEVDSDKVSDWAYPSKEQGDYVGNFSERVLRGK